MAKQRDGDLVLRARKGDSDAFGVLVTKYLATITLLAYQKIGDRSEAEDLAQEAFVRAFRSLNTLREPDKFGGWVYNIALRLALDWLRKRSRRTRSVSFDLVSERGGIPQDSLRPDEQNIRAERLENLRSAMAALPDPYRLVLTLRYMKKMTYRDIAEHLDEPEGTIANRLHRATRLLRERMTRGARFQ